MSEQEKGSKALSMKYTKAQFLGSRQRKGIEKDILSIVLEEDRTYTLREANELIRNFKKKKVK